MAQNFTLGKIGLATTAGGDGLEVLCSNWSQEGDSADVEGVIRKQATLADLKSIRDQFQGYGPQNFDEPIIPVTWTEDATRDGWYRVESCDVSSEVTGRLGSPLEAGGNTAYTWKAKLTRVAGGWQAPLLEVMYSEKLRTNAHAIASGSTSGWLALPGTATSIVNTVAGPSRTTLTTAVGSTVTLFDVAAPDTNWYGGALKTFSYRVPAGSAYAGAARIESGSALRVLTGRQIISDVANWRISNDLVRIAPSGANLVVGVYDTGAAAWETKTWSPYFYDDVGTTTYFMGTPTTVTVLRNSPEACTVRLSYNLNGAVQFPSGAGTYTAVNDSAYVDLTVYRGARWVEGITVISNFVLKLAAGIAVTTAEAATAVTGGVEATAADASGNKYRAYTPLAKTNDLVQGGFRCTSLTVTSGFPWGIGTNIANSIALYYFTAAAFTQLPTTA
jgi:hypothetical protein